MISGTSLEVQWLNLSLQGGVGSIPGWEAKIPHALPPCPPLRHQGVPAAPHGALCRGESALPAVPLTRTVNLIKAYWEANSVAEKVWVFRVRKIWDELQLCLSDMELSLS